MARRLWVPVGIVVLGVVVVLLLVTGGDPGTDRGTDESGDVVVEDGEIASDDARLADILEADVRRESGLVIFEATMADELPEDLNNRSLEFRWDLTEGGEDTWIVSASITIEVTAAVTSQRTAYGSSTIDGSMPGNVTIDGDRLEIELEAGKIQGFPDTFEWRLTSTFNSDLRDTTSPVARDSLD